MKCEEVRRSIDLYLDGEFGPQEKALIEQHLAECPACRSFANQQYQVKQSVKAAFTNIHAPFRLELAVHQGLSQKASQRFLHLSMAFAAMLLVLGLVLWLFLPQIMYPTRPQIVQANPTRQAMPITLPVSTGRKKYLRPVPQPLEPVNYRP